MRTDPNDTETGPSRTSAPGEQAASAPDGRPARAANPPSERSGVHPAKALAIVAALILIATGLAWWSLPDEPADDTNITPSSNTNPEPELLTEAEALNIWRDLTEHLDEAMEERDLKAISQIVTETGPAWRRSRGIVKSLLRDDVVDKTTVETKSAEVVNVGLVEIRISEVRVLRPCVITVKGRDVTDAPGDVEQTALWVLKRVDNDWLIHDAILKRDRFINQKSGRCSREQFTE